jgi:hypothetical protein
VLVAASCRRDYCGRPADGRAEPAVVSVPFRPGDASPLHSRVPTAQQRASAVAMTQLIGRSYTQRTSRQGCRHCRARRRMSNFWPSYTEIKCPTERKVTRVAQHAGAVVAHENPGALTRPNRWTGSQRARFPASLAPRRVVAKSVTLGAPHGVLSFFVVMLPSRQPQPAHGDRIDMRPAGTSRGGELIFRTVDVAGSSAKRPCLATRGCGVDKSKILVKQT